MEPAGKLAVMPEVSLHLLWATAMVFAGVTLSTEAIASPASSRDWLRPVQNAVSQGTCTQEMMDKLTQSVTQDPSNPELHLTLGEAFQAKGYEQLAKEQYEQANRQDKEYLLKHFHARLAGMDPRNPLRLFLAAKQEFPDDAGVVYYDAFRQQVLGNQDDALNLMRRAVARPKPWPGSAGMLAEMEAGLNLWDDAARHADQQLKIDPNNVQALSVHIRAQVRAGAEPKDLLPDLIRASKLDRGDPYMCFVLARAYVDSRKYADALDPALRVLVMPYGVNDKSKLSLVSQIYRHVPYGKFCQSVDQVASGIMNPMYRPYFRWQASEVLQENGRPDGALRQLQSSALSGESRLDPELAVKLGDLAQSRYGDYLLALNFYTQAEAQAPKDPRARSAKDALMSRLANYKNDLGWQLRNTLQGRTSTMPQLRLFQRPPQLNSAPLNSGQ